MAACNIRKKAKAFRKQYRLDEITYEKLSYVFRKQGFTIIEFNPVLNDDDVATVIRNLNLDEAVKRSRGFLYMDGNFRLVFVNEKLTTDEKTLVLAHEEGHYYCGHILQKSYLGTDVIEEYEANEFVHYLLEKNYRERISHFAKNYRKRFIAAIICIILVAGGGIAIKQYHDWKIYEGTYFVTVHGEKYHLRNCVTIQGHKTRRLTKEDIDSGKYEPCSVCMPDLNRD